MTPIASKYEYVVTLPKNLNPLFFISFETVSESLFVVINWSKSPYCTLLSVNDQIYFEKVPNFGDSILNY